MATSTEQILLRRIKSITAEQAEQQMSSLKRELDALRAEILKKDRSKPDAKLVLRGKSAIQNFEIMAVAATRLREGWSNATHALDALEAWRADWHIISSAAMLHARRALLEMEEGTPEYERTLKTILDLVDMVGATFRPLTGAPARWLKVQADEVDKVDAA